MKMRKLLFISIISIVLYSCNKKEDTPIERPQKPPEQQAQMPVIQEPIYVETISVEKEGALTRVKFLNAKSMTKWTYFSLKEGKLVQVENPKESLSWDLAFQRYYVRTNSGLSGKGDGGAMKVSQVEFNVLTSNFAIGPWAVDTEEPKIMPKGVPVSTEKMAYNKALIWAEYKMPTGSAYVPTYEVYKESFIVKAADGKKYGLQFTDIIGPAGNDHTKPEGGAGFPSFIYKELP